MCTPTPFYSCSSCEFRIQLPHNFRFFFALGFLFCLLYANFPSEKRRSNGHGTCRDVVEFPALTPPPTPLPFSCRKKTNREICLVLSLYRVLAARVRVPVRVFALLRVSPLGPYTTYNEGYFRYFGSLWLYVTSAELCTHQSKDNPSFAWLAWEWYYLLLVKLLAILSLWDNFLLMVFYLNRIFK